MIWLMIAAALLLAAIVFLIVRGNTRPVLREYTVSAPDLPREADGMRIVQVSDLHNAVPGGSGRLLHILRQARPDLIALTGDLFDARRKRGHGKALGLAVEAVKIAPCYWIMGNHEARLPDGEELAEALAACGVTVLRNESRTLLPGLILRGVDDPALRTDDPREEAAVMEAQLAAFPRDGFSVLLSHRPECFELYVRYGADLVLTGHAHGGQWRFPGAGGLFAPRQGLFPRYDGGLYADGRTVMIVSRGLGNSLFPFRLFNPPEAVAVTLHKNGQDEKTE